MVKLVPVSGRGSSVGDFMKESAGDSLLIEDYLRIRQNNFPMGVMGRIVGFTGQGDVCVRFDDRNMVGVGGWGKYQFCRGFWNGDDKRVAAYSRSEVDLFTHVNDIDRGLFLQQVERLREGFTHYR